MSTGGKGLPVGVTDRAIVRDASPLCTLRRSEREPESRRVQLVAKGRDVMHRTSPGIPDVGERVRALRQERGLSLRQLAGLVGVSAATLSQIETGKVSAQPARVTALAEALEVEPTSLDAATADSAGQAERRAEGGRHWRTYEPLKLDSALKAALQSFTATGYHGASVRDIARRCGLSVPGLYHYYPSKQAMLTAVFDLAMADLLERAEAARAEGRTTLERFSYLIESLALYHAHRPDLAFLGTSEMRSLATRDRRRITLLRSAQQQMVDDEVEAGVAKGIFRTPLPHAASRAVVTMCVAVANWYRPGGLYTPEEIASQYVQFSLGVIGYCP